MVEKFDFSRINWINTSFLIGTPILVLIAVPWYVATEGLHLGLLALFLVYCVFTSISITGGYHRLFAHRSYEANTALKLFYLLFGAAAGQNSCLKWSKDHRIHHRYVDSENDPYNIRRGFFFAHMGWIFFKDQTRAMAGEMRFQDLENDKLVAWQDKYYGILTVVVGFSIPTMIGLAFGHPFGGLLFGGFARIVLTHHCTFFINSLCHMWGSQPYGDKTSARDSYVLALLTYGEGYHNFHHRFEADYRNGIRWYHWDPTKWLIKMGSFFGITRNLRKVSDAEILRARLAADEKKLIQVGAFNERLQEIRRQIEEKQKQFQQFKQRYRELKSELSHRGDERLAQLRRDMQTARREFKMALEQWQILYRQQMARVQMTAV